MSGPKVGIFFKIDDLWLIDAVAVEEGEPYGDAIQHGAHYAYWESLVPRCPAEYRFKHHDYDYYPRGRVVHFPQRQTYRIYRDSCLTEEDLNLLVELFSLSGMRWEVVDDSHYQCARCNQYYVD